MPALLTRPASVSPFKLARTSRAAASTAASSVTSNISGVKLAPNSPLRRSASACLRTLPKTRKPRSSSSFAVAQPMPVDAPVMTTDFMIGPSRHCERTEDEAIQIAPKCFGSARREQMLLAMTISRRKQQTLAIRSHAPYSAWPSMIGPNSCHFSPVNFIICTCSIG